MNELNKKRFFLPSKHSINNKDVTKLLELRSCYEIKIISGPILMLNTDLRISLY